MKWCVLSGIGLENIVSPSELADHIGITRPATSRLLNELRNDGLVAQALDQSDGRSRRLSITGQGQKTLRQCLPLVDENEKYLADKLDGESLQLFSRTLNLLLDGETAELDNI